MEVLSFLEVNQLGVDEQVEYGNWIANTFKLETRLVDFYAQPFKPELISELFEGWELVTDNHLFSEYSCEEYALNYSYKKDGNMNFYIHDTRVSHCPFPRTLDDFIKDCQRAGIILKWRKK